MQASSTELVSWHLHLVARTQDMQKTAVPNVHLLLQHSACFMYAGVTCYLFHIIAPKQQLSSVLGAEP